MRLLFQPAEEGGGGGEMMADAGALGAAGAIFGLHVWPGIETGIVASRAGTLMAASGSFSVVLVGKGGHGAMPHQTIDPVPALGAIILALQVRPFSLSPPFSFPPSFFLPFSLPSRRCRAERAAPPPLSLSFIGSTGGGDWGSGGGFFQAGLITPFFFPPLPRHLLRL